MQRNKVRLTIGRLLACVSLAAIVTPRTAGAQCEAQWLAGEGVPGALSPISAMTLWDPDGPGPMPTRLVAGGGFTIAGNQIHSGVAQWDAATETWSPVGEAFFAAIQALTAMPDGSLIVAGRIYTIGTTDVNHIARWDGATWRSLDGGVSGGNGGWSGPHVTALTLLPAGDLIATGNFTTAGGVGASRIARWDGNAWHALGLGLRGGFPPFFEPVVTAVTTASNGDVVAGGFFTTAGDVPVVNIARWDGRGWQPMGDGLAGFLTGTVTSLLALPGGEIIAGGSITASGGAAVPGVARWDGLKWNPLGTGLSGPTLLSSVDALVQLPSGDIIAGGTFTLAGTVQVAKIARWDGAVWSAMGEGIHGKVREYDPRVSSLITMPGGDLIVGGSFVNAGDQGVHHMARWNSTGWHRIGTGLNNQVLAIAAHDSGGFIAGGKFTNAGTIGVMHIARWDRGEWTSLGSGTNGTVWALHQAANGDVYAGGDFTMAGGIAANHIARWDGSQWHALGGGLTAGQPDLTTVRAITTLPGGDLVAAGEFRMAGGVAATNIARWDGTAWHPLHRGLFGGQNGLVLARALAALPSGEVVAAGWFSNAGDITARNIARWDGSQWHPFTSGADSFVHALMPLPGGGLVAAGGFQVIGGETTDGIAQFDNTAWHALGAGNERRDKLALTRLPNGDIVAGGRFQSIGGVPAKYIARWDGIAWNTMGSGLSYREVSALATLTNGDLVAGGGFIAADDRVSAYLARWGCACYSDCDQSTGVGVLDIFDFLCFQSSFVAADPYACDCDTSTGQLVCDIFDFLCFQNAFVAGCP